MESHVDIDGVRYSHVVDPRTGMALVNRARAVVIGPDATLTDGLSTALCVVGPAGAAAILGRFPGYEAEVTTPRSRAKA